MIPNSVIVSCCFQAHITSPNVELSQAALQALGFCLYHSRVVSGVPGTIIYIFYTSFRTLPGGIKFCGTVVILFCLLFRNLCIRNTISTLLPGGEVNR